MLEPFQQIPWSRLDRKAWGVGLSLLVVCFLFALLAFFYGQQWTYQIGIEYIPKEIKIKAYEIGNDLMELPLNLPNYAFGEYFVLEEILPPLWIYPIVSLAFLLIISFLAAGVSWFYGTWFYGSLTAMALGTSIFGPEAFSPFGFTDKWLSAIAVLVICGPVYVIKTWFSHWNLSRRWWVILLFYGGLFFGFLFEEKAAFHAHFVAQLWPILAFSSLAFILFNSTDVLQGVLSVVSRDEGSKQSWLHFTLFSLLYLSNFLLTYLKNSGKWVLDIVYINPFLLQAFTLILGFWMLPRKMELSEDESGRNVGLSTVYLALASLFLLTTTLAFGLANNLMVEVLEDAITLINFCMGSVFFLYVFINFFRLMMMGLRVHMVMFRPMYMPVFAIPIFGLGGVWIFLLNDGYFTYSQILAAQNILLADQAQINKDYFLAENYLQLALNQDFRSQRANLSMAGLQFKTGNPAQAQVFAEASLDKFPTAEAHLCMAQIYRQKKQNLQEILQLQQALRSFPGNGLLQNNLGMAFTETIYKDSAQFYFSGAAQSRNASKEGNANLAYFYLTNRLETEGLPQKSPDQNTKGDWAGLNNKMVFANIAHEKSPDLPDIQADFDKIPESIQPFLLFHAYLNKAITQDSSGFSDWQKLENDTIKQYYQEPITLSKAMVLYRTGAQKAAVEMLQGLLNSASGVNRLDLLRLLGEIYFEQGAYASASDCFRQAAFMQLKKANYWFALSCLDAGRKDDAAEAFSDVLPELGEADKIRVSVLIDGLKSGKFHNAAQRSDPEKSAYIKVNWNSLSDKQIVDLIYLVSDKESQQYLWQYAFDRAYRESLASRSQALFKFAKQEFGRKEKWIRQLNQNKGKYLEITRQFKALDEWMKSNGEETAHPFFKARLALESKDSAEAKKWYLVSIENQPFNLRQVGTAIHFLSQKQETRSLAYQKSLEISNLDPQNVEYLKLYAWLSLKEGLPEFAYQVLPKISLLTTPQVASDFRKKLDEELARKNYPGMPLP